MPGDVGAKVLGHGMLLPGLGRVHTKAVGVRLEQGACRRHEAAVQPSLYTKVSSGSPAGVLSSPHCPVPGGACRVIRTKFPLCRGHGPRLPREGWPVWASAPVTSDDPPRAQCSGLLSPSPKAPPSGHLLITDHTQGLKATCIQSSPPSSSGGPRSFRVQTSDARPWSQSIEVPALGLATPRHLGSLFKPPGNHGGLLLCSRGGL